MGQCKGVCIQRTMLGSPTCRSSHMCLKNPLIQRCWLPPHVVLSDKLPSGHPTCSRGTDLEISAESNGPILRESTDCGSPAILAESTGLAELRRIDQSIGRTLQRYQDPWLGMTGLCHGCCRLRRCQHEHPQGPAASAPRPPMHSARQEAWLDQ